MIFLSTLLLAVLITIVLIPLLSSLAMRYQLVDIPNDRKVHHQPIPRVGGIAMALGAFIPIVYWNYAERFVHAYLAGGCLLVLFGAVDDFRDLSPGIKFAGQIAAALIAILYGGVEIRNLGMLAPDNFLLPEWIAIPLTLLAIVGVTNAINLADGLDGLAGGICLLIFCCIGFLAYLGGNNIIGLISLALAGSIFGFLRFNTYPASVFMGDAGSQFLGFSAITLSLALTQGQTPLSPVLPLILVGFPVLDTLTVMCTRIARGRSPFAADKNHFHHNLMGIGLHHSESVLAIYIIQTVLVVVAYLFRFQSEWLLLLGYLFFSTLIVLLFSLATRTGWHFVRFDLLDMLIIGNLKRLREEGTIIRVTFRIFENGIPFLLFLTCLLPAQVPRYVSAASLGMLAVLLVAWLLRREMPVSLLRMVLYLLIPFAVYLSDHNMPLWMDEPIVKSYNCLFGMFAVFIIIISKFSRRRGGFKSTPLDFLILFLVLVGPNLPDLGIQDSHIGLVAAKVIILYFCFEVLIAELRGKCNRLAVAILGSLLVIGIR